MKKRSLILLTALVSVSAFPVVSPILASNNAAHITAQETENQRRVALGASLDADQRTQTLSLLGVSDVTESNLIKVDGNLINSYLADGSTAATPVYSSVSIEPRESGYGVQIQIITPNNILLVAPQTYQNAAITAGAKDVLIKIAAVTPVTGEGALTGVYSIYETSGQQLSQQSIQVAQKEIEVVNKVQETEGLSEAHINLLQTNIKQIISTTLQSTPELNETELIKLVQEAIQAFETEHGVTLSEDSIAELTNLAIEYSQTETAINEDTTEQLEASTASGWTMPQAIDFWEATFLSGINGERVTHENYDRSYWTEVSSDETSIVLHLRNAGSGGNYYLFEKSDTVTILTLFSGNATYPDNPTAAYWVRNSDFRLYQEYDYFTETLTEYAEDGTSTESQAPGDSLHGEDSEAAGEIWSSEKSAELADFMATWGVEMEQNYTSYEPGATGSMYGPSFPTEIIASLAVNNELVSAFWSYDGVSYGEYAIVGAYSDYEDIEQFERFPNFYLFAIIDDQPVVLHSQQNEGQPDGLIHFSATENAELQAAFEAIVWN